MAKLTVTKIKKQIALLEARAARLAHAETNASVGKVRALMNQLGVTLEHLSSAVARRGAAVRKSLVGAKPAPAKRTGKGIAKYRDPATGATWSGFGRAPGWIAGAADRGVFLVGSSPALKAPPKPASVAKKAAAKKVAAKKPVPSKASANAPSTSTKPAKAVTKKVASKAATPVVLKKKPAANATGKRATARKAATKEAASASVVAAPTVA